MKTKPEYTKEQCLYALKQSIERARFGNIVCLHPEVAVGIYNYLSNKEKLYIKRKDGE